MLLARVGATPARPWKKANPFGWLNPIFLWNDAQLACLEVEAGALSKQANSLLYQI